MHEAGGLVFAAHPFHTGGGSSLTLGFRDRVPILREIVEVGVEVINRQVAADANAQAQTQTLARQLGVPGIGGSDAHAVDRVGSAATRFARPLRSDAELVAALRSEAYAAVRL